MHGWKILLSYRRLHDYAEDDSWPSVKHELTKHLNSPTGGIDDDMFELLYDACVSPDVQSSDMPHSRNSTNSWRQSTNASSDTMASRAPACLPCVPNTGSHEEEDEPESDGSEVYDHRGPSRPDPYGSYEDDDNDGSFPDSCASGQASQCRKNIIWRAKDPLAPQIRGSAELKSVTQACGLARMQSKDNNRGALYCCGHCQLFLRKFKWQPGHNKDTREVTVHLPNNEELLHHDSSCPRAPNPWNQSFVELAPGQGLTMLGREYIVMSLKGGALPMSLCETINSNRLKENSPIAQTFPNAVTVQQIRNISAYESERRRKVGSTGPLFLMSRNAGAKAWCEEKGLRQECYAEVHRLHTCIAKASTDTQRNMLEAQLKSSKMAKELFVIDTCVDEKGNLLGIVFSNAIMCLNLQQAISKLGANRINVAIDGTFQLSKGGWALISMGTHSIEVHRESRSLCHKFRPFIYMFAFSESKVVFVHMDKSLKRLAAMLCEVENLTLAADAAL